MSDLRFVKQPEEMASYKDVMYRQGIASRCGIYLLVNEKGFQTPYLVESYISRKRTLMEEMREECNDMSKMWI